MARRTCPRHGDDHPCSCAMGNLYRFVEPVLLLLLREKGCAHGYELAGDMHEYSLTDAEIELAALYRTLRQLEENACVTSEWDVNRGGPARRLYRLTPRGEEHLDEWITVLSQMSESIGRLVKAASVAKIAPQASSGRTSSGTSS